MKGWKYFIQLKLMNFYVFGNYWLLKHESKLSPAKKEAVQRRKIKKLVRAAMKHELYREKFKAANLDPKTVCTQKDLERLAPLTKEEYRDLVKAVMDQDTKGYYRYCKKDRTSGSTGMPMYTCLTPAEYGAVIAQLLFILDKNGYRVFLDSSLDVRSPLHEGAGNAKSLLQKIGLLRKYYVSSSDSPEYIIKEINRLRPVELKANKSIMHAILQYAEEHQLKVHPAKYIVSSAEPMDEITRELISKYFGPNALIDIYASTEAGLLGYTMCDDSRKFHLNPSHYLYTVRNELGELDDYGDLLITNLYMKLFPMINYKQGDIVDSYVDEADGNRYLRAVLGRSNDYLVLRDGRRISYLYISPAIARYFTEIEWYRLVQEEYGSLKVVMVQRKSSTKTREEIEEGLTKQLQHFVEKDLEYTFEWVDHIPVDPNGKIRVLVSHVK